jgi:phosphoribosylaminoimidazolecarboxamide formyltransferase/IMP cyclohydrolase
MKRKIQRALLSLARPQAFLGPTLELAKYGVELWASSGTAKFLRSNGLEVRDLVDLTGFSELLGGRVKTLHPNVFAGILANPENPGHTSDLERIGGVSFDLIVVDLYPFDEGIKNGLEEAGLRELIDVGGVALIRAAAKNAPFVSVAVDMHGFSLVLKDLKEDHGHVRPETSLSLAVRAFGHTSAYDALIAKTLFEQAGSEAFPELLLSVFERTKELRYGENPHQRAYWYRPRLSQTLELTALQGKELSYNNLLDAEAAYLLVREFDRPAVSVIKHSNPCGVAAANTIEEAFEKALDCDTKSAFGGVVACNRPIDEKVAERMRPIFLEVVLAPAYSEGAMEILQAKRNTRFCTLSFDKPLPALTSRETLFGLLLQDRDLQVPSKGTLEVASHRKPTPEQLEDMKFAIDVAKHVRSNAIVFAKNLSSVGIGAGQMSRVDSVRLAALKAEGRAKGAVMGSDAFFPFPDGVEYAHEAGIEAFIAPKGSVRDKEVLEAADRLGMVCVFASSRHFRH